MIYTVEAHTGRDHYRTEIRTSTHVLLADEPGSNGGMDQGPSPHELLAAALGGCTNATLRMYADRKEWPLEAVDTRVEIEHGESVDTTTFRRTIRLSGNLTVEQRTRLLQIAERCPIHRTITGAVTISTKLL